jgi:hypothetical protein
MAMKSADAGAYFDRLARRLNAADGAGVEYGIRDEPHYSGLTTAQLARRLERGDPDRGLPARPFFEQAEEDMRVISPRLLRRAVQQIQKGKSPERALDTLADAAREALVRAIDNFDDPSNAASTIKRKGRDDPLVSTGAMRDAADAVVVLDAGSNADMAGD